MKADIQQSQGEAKKRFESIKQSLVKQINDIKSNVIDTSSVSTDFKNELSKVSDELLAEKSIKNLVEL